MMTFELFEEKHKETTHNRLSFIIGLIGIGIALIGIWADVKQLIFVGLFSALGTRLLIFFVGLTDAGPLHGKLAGQLTFKEDGISINGKHIKKEDIAQLKIKVQDYHNKFTADHMIGSGNVGPARSPGVGNTIELRTSSGVQHQHQFQISSKDRMEALNELLKAYYAQWV